MVVQQAAREFTTMPGPPGKRLFGNGLRFRDDPLGALLDDMHTHGDLVRYDVLPGIRPLHVKLVAAHHPDDVRTVLTQTERALSKQTVGFRALTEMLGRGLLTTEGEQWRRQRRTVQPLFTRRTIDRYAELMAREATGLQLAPGEIDLDLEMRRYTLRVVGRALFSEDIDDTVQVLHRLVPQMSDIAVRRTLQPLRLPMWLPSPGNLRIRRVLRRQDAIVDRIVSGRSAPGLAAGTAAGAAFDRGAAFDGGAAPERGAGPGAGHDSGGERDDLVTRLRAARDPETGEPLSEQELRDQVLVFLMAGHETTAGALTFTLHLLGRHPDEQEAVAAELAEVLGARTAPSSQDLPRLVRTRAALLEAMRLYPPVYLTERMTVEPVRLGDYQVPAGVMLLVAPWTTHRHPEFWPEPDRFDPSRFAGTHERPHYAYFPFGGGPRGCVGEHFALLEATILLAALLHRYRVESRRADLAVEPMVTLRPAGPVPIHLTPRG